MFQIVGLSWQNICVNDETPPEERLKWQKEFSSGWIPPNNSIHPSGLEETCVKSSAQVRILGIAYGYELLDFHTQQQLKDCFGTGDTLDPDEDRILDAMVEDLGIIYSNTVHLGSQLMLSTDRFGRLRLDDWTGEDNQLWSRTWDCCLENKATGEVVTLDDDDGDGPVLRQVDQIGNKSQKWRLDGKNRFLHKQSKKNLSSDGGGGVVMKMFHQGGERETWMFRCLDQTRTTDSFVNYTPWHDMTVWG